MLIKLPLFYGNGKVKTHLVPSLNVMLAEHFRKRMARKKLLTILCAQMQLEAIKGSFSVCYTSYRVRPLDVIDNLGASLKTIMDVLQDLKLIGGDSREFITERNIETIQVKVKTKAEEHFTLEILPIIDKGGEREFY